MLSSYFSDWLIWSECQAVYHFLCPQSFYNHPSEITEAQLTVGIQNSQWYTGDCTAWQKTFHAFWLSDFSLFIVISLPQAAAGSQTALGFWQGFLGVMMKTVSAARALPPQHKWPPCLPSRLTGKVSVCVSAFTGDSLVCHTYFHHIKFSSSLS